MYAKQFVPIETQRPHFLATLLYTFIYALLWLRHRARNLYLRLHHAFHRSHKTLFRPLQSCQYTTPLQTHIAFSGHIASHLDNLAQIIVFLVNHGTAHITLYDHLQHINPTQLTALIHQHGLHAFHLSHIGIEQTHSLYSTCEHQSSSHQCQSRTTTHSRTTDSQIRLTIVNPGAGRASIARSARLLADRQSETSPVVDAQSVTEWLDADQAQCMLPSEPDTLVVFPSTAGPPIPVLNGFPVWQLRLTQIRFSSIPVADCSSHQLLDMITSAANAPKRFGR